MRKSYDELYMNIAREFSEMGTCARRQVGCVLVDGDNKFLSAGFNGVPPKWPHCRSFDAHFVGTGVRCPGADAKSGESLDDCVANHAEQNALLQCPDVSRIRTVYSTTSPCVDCVKKLLCTRATRIVFLEDYPQPKTREYWLRHPLITHSIVSLPRTWEHYDPRTKSITVASTRTKV